MQASYKKHVLQFKQASGTSRGVLKTKDTYFLVIEANGRKGIGECGLFRGLSSDDKPDYEDRLQWVCENISLGKDFLVNKLQTFPSIQFGLEQAFLSLNSENPFELYPSKFLRGEQDIAINGLIWMGDKSFMKEQIITKINAGFKTIKLKIGAIDFETELELLKFIRSQFSSQEIELRVDANGAFEPSKALEKLKRLSDFELHSIEQPIRQGQLNIMAKLCSETPLPIALDEELIGIVKEDDRKIVIETIMPQYIILKPSLVGGFQGTKSWIELANARDIGWWITSALESNIGLNAIAQFTHDLQTKMPQGLGTGNLFTNNIESPLFVENGFLKYNSQLNWNFKL